MGRFARPSITGPPGGVDADLPSLRTALGLLYGLGGGLVGSWAMGALVQVTGISGLPKPEWIRWWYRHPLHVPLLHLTVCLALCYGFVAGRPWGRYAAVAYNSASNEYLVVWAGDDDTGTLVEDEREIFGQRLNAATGAQVGGNDFRICTMGPNGDTNYDARDPAVAYNSVNNEYLVVWEGDDNTGTLVDGEFEIFGQRLTATGGQVGTNELLLYRARILLQYRLRLFLFFERKVQNQKDNADGNGRVGYVERGPVIALDVEIQKIDYLPIPQPI